MSLNPYASGPQFDYFVAWRFLFSGRFRRRVQESWREKGNLGIVVDLFLGLGSLVLSSTLFGLLILLLWSALSGGGLGPN